MARIVVNKHFDNSANITADKFVNKGELVISNEPGYEGLYILNKNGEVIKIGQYSGGTSGGGNLSEDVKEFLKKYYMTSAQTVDYVEEFSGNVVTALENFQVGHNLIGTRLMLKNHHIFKTSLIFKQSVRKKSQK